MRKRPVPAIQSFLAMLDLNSADFMKKIAGIEDARAKVNANHELKFWFKVHCQRLVPLHPFSLCIETFA